MTPAQLKRWCLSLPDALETFPFEDHFSVFKHRANTRMFAITALGSTPLDVTLKCDPDHASLLRATYASIRPGYHVNKRHWITVTLDADVDDDLVKCLVTDSYDLIKPHGGLGRGDPGRDAAAPRLRSP